MEESTITSDQKETLAKLFDDREVVSILTDEDYQKPGELFDEEE